MGAVRLPKILVLTIDDSLSAQGNFNSKKRTVVRAAPRAPRKSRPWAPTRGRGWAREAQPALSQPRQGCACACALPTPGSRGGLAGVQALAAQPLQEGVRPADAPPLQLPAFMQKGTRVLISLWDSLMFGRVPFVLRGRQGGSGGRRAEVSARSAS